MKKTIIALMAMGSVMVMAEPDVHAVARAQAYAANVATNGTFADWFIPCMTNDMETAAAVDNILSVCAKPPTTRYYKMMEAYFPKTRAAYIAKLRLSCPFLAATLAHEDVKWTPETRASFFFELIATSKETIVIHLPNVEKYTLKGAAVAIRRHLRSQGKGIVTKDGVNPVQVELDKVSACLNAPRFAGLGNALGEYGANIHVMDFKSVPSGAELVSMTNSIFLGEEPFTDLAQAQLRYALGLQEYNRFVEAYNR